MDKKIDDSLELEKIPKWITFYGFAIILLLLVIIPIVLLNFKFTFKYEDVAIKDLKDNQTIISLKVNKKFNVAQNQEVEFKRENLFYSGFISKIEYLKNDSSFLNLTVVNIRKINPKAKFKEKDIIITDESLFLKIFKSLKSF